MGFCVNVYIIVTASYTNGHLFSSLADQTNISENVTTIVINFGIAFNRAASLYSSMGKYRPFTKRQMLNYFKSV